MRLRFFGVAALHSFKLPGACVRWDWLCHLSAAEAVTQYCGFPSRNDDCFRDFAWQKSASLHSHESRACHWAGRDTAIRPLCHNGTIGWHWSDPRWTCRFHSSSSPTTSPPPPPPLPPCHPAENKHRRWLLEPRIIITAPCAQKRRISLEGCVIPNQQVGVTLTRNTSLLYNTWLRQYFCLSVFIQSEHRASSWK